MVTSTDKSRKFLIRYYVFSLIHVCLIFSDDAEKMFEEAKVVSPNRKVTISTALSNTATSGKYWIGRKSSISGTSSSGSHPAEAFDCEICFLSLPRSVSFDPFFG